MYEHIKRIIESAQAIGVTVTCSVYEGRATSVVVQATDNGIAGSLASQLGAPLRAAKYKDKSWFEARIDVDGVMVSVMGPHTYAQEAA